MRPILAPLVLCFGSLLPAVWGATPVRAGAWPREAGTGFVTVTTQMSWPQEVLTGTVPPEGESYSTLYLEYGLTDRVTLGMDIGRGVSGAGKTVAFVQMPLRARDSGPQVSVQLGFGQISDARVLRPGLSVGWGRPRGWLSFDALAEIRGDGSATDVKLDVTWGRTLPKDRKLIVQLQTGLQQDDPGFARLAPSLVLPLGKRLKLEVGGTYGLSGDTDMGLKLGLWASF